MIGKLAHSAKLGYYIILVKRPCTHLLTVSKKNQNVCLQVTEINFLEIPEN